MIEQAGARGPRVGCAEPVELGVVGRALRAVAIDEIEQAAADALDRGDIERLLRGAASAGSAPSVERALIGVPRIDDAERHRRRAGSVRGDEVEAVRAGLLVDEVVDVALAIEGDASWSCAAPRRRSPSA